MIESPLCSVLDRWTAVLAIHISEYKHPFSGDHDSLVICCNVWYLRHTDIKSSRYQLYNTTIDLSYGWLLLIQYTPRNMHTVFALLCFVVVIHWLIFPYPSGLLHWHCGNLTTAPVPAKQPWWIWINTSFWIHYERLHNYNKANHSKTVCIFLGIYYKLLAQLFGGHCGNTMVYVICSHTGAWVTKR